MLFIGMGFIAGLLSLSIAQASETIPAPWYYGFQLGFNNSSVTTDNRLAGTMTGLEAGGRIEYGATSWLDFEFRVLWDEKGYMLYESESFDSAHSTTFTLEYLEVPFLTKIDFTSGELVKPYLVFGPYFAKLLPITVAEKRFRAPDTSRTVRAKATDYGVDFGVQTEYQVGSSTRAFVELLYSYGLEKFTDDGTRNRSAQISIGFSFAI
jgi:hypothetical protein